MTHVLVITSHRSGVLARITSIVSASGINIDTATAYPISGSELAVVHLRVAANADGTDRIRRKLSRLVDVIEVRVEQERDGAAVQLGAVQQLRASGDPRAQDGLSLLT